MLAHDGTATDGNAPMPRASATKAPTAPEVLAPAGDADALRAAVAAGADAVYFGLRAFNARARAANFDEADLASALRFLHENGRRGYVTLNTLVFDDELERVEASVRACVRAGADAVIVQDLGVLRLVRAVAPELRIHASTQMTCTDRASVGLAAKLGASRVILARELSLEQIAQIRAQTAIELEVFVHGALCISYSGQCLTSEAIGGRSANRGACAQACRLPYEVVVDGEPRPESERTFLLSPEDLEASALVPRLIGIGVNALKIEGRLKGADYVATTTRLYRRAVDGALGRGPGPTKEDVELALQSYSRGSGTGFLLGLDHQRLVEGRSSDHRGLEVGVAIGTRAMRGRRYLVLRAERTVARGDGVLVEGGAIGTGEIGGRVWGVRANGADVERGSGELLLWFGPEQMLDGVVAGRRVFRTNDPQLRPTVERLLEREQRRAPLVLRVSGQLGEPPLFRATTRSGLCAEVAGDTRIEAGTTRTTTEDVLRDKLGRLGETPFVLDRIDVALPEGCFIPLSTLNRARRLLVEQLLAASHSPRQTSAASGASLGVATTPDRPPPPGGLFVLVRNVAQARAALGAGADGVYLDFLDLTGVGAAVRELRSEGKTLGVALPRVRKPGEEAIDERLLGLDVDVVLVRSLGSLVSAVGSGKPTVGDFSLNVTNRISASEVLGAGLVAFTPSFDLDAAQLLALLDGPLAPFAEVVAHHPMPLFHMEHCLFAALLSDGGDPKTCGRPCEQHSLQLRDRAGMDHAVEADVGCRNTVFHAAAQSAAELIDGLRRRSVRRYRIELVRETPADVSLVVDTYQKLIAGTRSARDVWRTLRADGGYGIVRGSLRLTPG